MDITTPNSVENQGVIVAFRAGANAAPAKAEQPAAAAIRPELDAPFLESPRRNRVDAARDIAGGLVGMAFSGLFIGLELARNWHYGLTAHEGSALYAVTYAGFAVGLVAVPAIRAGGLLAAKPAMGALLFCYFMTAFCGVAFYADDITRAIGDKAKLTRDFSDARAGLEKALADQAAAQAEADKIPEKRPVAVLKALHEEDKAAAEREAGRRTCGPLCETAKAKANATLELLGQAEARERFQKRADEAGARADAFRAQSQTGPGQITGMAALIAMLPGVGDDRAEMTLAVLIPCLLVFGGLALTVVFFPSLVMFLRGVGIQATASTAPVVASAPRPSLPDVAVAAPNAPRLAPVIPMETEAARQQREAAEAAELARKEAARASVLTADEKRAAVIAELFTDGATWRPTADLRAAADRRLLERFGLDVEQDGQTLRVAGDAQFTDKSFFAAMTAAGFQQVKDGQPKGRKSGWFVDVA